MDIRVLGRPFARVSRWLTPEECRRLGAHLAIWELIFLILYALG